MKFLLDTNVLSEPLKPEPDPKALRWLEKHSAEAVAYDTRAADWHAAERARLTLAGRTPPFVDGQIAAVAAVHGLTLITRNLADFREFRGLKVKSIFAS